MSEEEMKTVKSESDEELERIDSYLKEGEQQERSIMIHSNPESEDQWRWVYPDNWRADPDDGVGWTGDGYEWSGAIKLDLGDEVGDYITKVAYFDYHAADDVRGHIAEDDNGVPENPPYQASTDVYDAHGAGWTELELQAPFKIENEEYWVVLELFDYSGDNYPVGVIAPNVENGGLIKTEGEHDWVCMHGYWDLDFTWTFEAFVIEGYELTIDSTTGGAVSQPGEGNFDHMEGTEVDLVAEVDEGYRFVGWSGDTGNIADPTSPDTTITMESDYTITAEFEVDSYDLTIDSTEGGGVIQPGEGTYEFDNGEVVTLEAEAAEHHHFVEWDGDIGTVADPTSPHTTITMEDDCAITAEFAIDTYELTIDSTVGGEVTQPAEGTFEYDHGTAVDIEASADENHLFVEWTGDIETIDDRYSAQTTVTMEDYYTITAEFAQSRELNLDVEGHGSLEIEGEAVETPYSVEYPDRTSIELTAEPADDWQFTHWSGDYPDGEQEEREISVYMDEDKSLTAHFLEEFEFTVSVEGEGTTDPEPDTHIRLDGQEVTVEAKPDEGWQFSYWEGDVPEGQREQETVTIVVDSDKSVIAHFIEKFDLTVEIVGEGGVEVDNEFVDTEWTGNYPMGTEVELTVRREKGWQFVEWRGYYEGTNEDITMIMDDDKSVTAIFERIEYELVIEVDGDGNTYPGQGTHKYPYEEEVMVEAFPEDGWVFEGWTGDHMGEETNAHITIDENKSLTATFLQKSYFVVEILTPDDDELFSTGDEVVVEFRVINEGDLSGTKDIEFYVGEEYVSSKSDLTLESGDTQTDEFVWNPDEDGEFDLEIRTADDRASSTITVEKRGIIAHLWWILILIAVAVIIALLLYRRKKDESEPPDSLSRKIEEQRRMRGPPPSKRFPR